MVKKGKKKGGSSGSTDGETSQPSTPHTESTRQAQVSLASHEVNRPQSASSGRGQFPVEPSGRGRGQPPSGDPGLYRGLPETVGSLPGVSTQAYGRGRPQSQQSSDNLRIQTHTSGVPQLQQVSAGRGRQSPTGGQRQQQFPPPQTQQQLPPQVQQQIPPEVVGELSKRKQKKLQQPLHTHPEGLTGSGEQSQAVGGQLQQPQPPSQMPPEVVAGGLSKRKQKQLQQQLQQQQQPLEIHPEGLTGSDEKSQAIEGQLQQPQVPPEVVAGGLSKRKQKQLQQQQQQQSLDIHPEGSTGKVEQSQAIGGQLQQPQQPPQIPPEAIAGGLSKRKQKQLQQQQQQQQPLEIRPDGSTGKVEQSQAIEGQLQQPQQQPQIPSEAVVGGLSKRKKKQLQQTAPVSPEGSVGSSEQPSMPQIASKAVLGGGAGKLQRQQQKAQQEPQRRETPPGDGLHRHQVAGGDHPRSDQPASGEGAPPRQRPPSQQSRQAPTQAPSVQSITEDIGQLSMVCRTKLNSGGTLGRRIIIETNHLPLKINPKVDKAIHYDITITPDKPKRIMRPVWEAFRQKYIPKYQAAFDDVKNVYSPILLPDPLKGEVLVQEDVYSRPKEYTVIVKYASTVNLAALDHYMKSGGTLTLPQDALQCLDIVLRNAPALRFVRVGRSYFTPPKDQIIKLGDGLEMWYGFYQSAILGWKPYLNVDVAHKGFPMEMTVLDLMAELSRCSVQDLQRAELGPREKDTVSKYLKGLKIRYEIPNQPASRRSMRVNGCREIPRNAKFTTENGTQSTVDKYYKDEKKYVIRYPLMPCLWVGSRNMLIYYPAELCTILRGQVTNRKMNEIQTREMVRNAATSTEVRKKKILQSVQQAGFSNDPCVKAFGLTVGTSFERVPARILVPPKLQYNPEIVSPLKGVWRSGAFIDGKDLTNWTVLVLSRTRDDDVEKFVNLIRNAARQSRMAISDVTRPYAKLQVFGRDTRNLRTYFTKNKHMQLIFVIVPEGDAYSKVKQEAELNVGCLTQCIKERTMFKSMNAATVGNILLKVNSKLNGQNHRFADVSKPLCLKRPCMIMGADVTHPSPEQRDIPSVAAVVASHDPAAFRYNFCWRLQPARQEIITDLENIMIEQIMFFFKQTKYKPEWIIFFRDGVSEGQFSQVLDSEVHAMRRACARIEPNYKPAITFLVVQKRHHTRFFPTDPRDSEDRNVNVPAGTCVDTEIIHPTALEYYLVSHASIQGVARPTKYRMLWDDKKMNEDEIQTLTYYLCHMFTRCTRSVSYPAPTYYAHLAAYRARVYLEGQNINLDNLEHEQLIRQIKEEICKDKPMFFV